MLTSPADRDLAAKRKKREAERDIGPLPKPKNQKFRDACMRKTGAAFRKWAKRYLPKIFYRPWAPFQIEAIDAMVKQLKKGQLALGWPRGYGKTTLCLAFIAWCIFCGFIRSVVLIEATKGLASDSISNFKRIFGYKKLCEDFPEVCYPIKCLGSWNKAKADGQHIGGVYTRIGWGSEEIIFPTVEGSKASGAKVVIRAPEAAFRGLLEMTSDEEGEANRPDMILINDPQTDEIAKNAERVNKLWATISQGIKGLRGDRGMSIFSTVTIIEHGDVAYKMLDREENPFWHGRKISAVLSMPNQMELWKQYGELAKQSHRKYEDNRLADQFYLDNRKLMDDGCKVAWEDFDMGFHSAIQYCMHMHEEDPKFFWSELQNDPQSMESDDVRVLSAGELQQKLSGVLRGVVPNDAAELTGFVDVQGDVAFWMTVAWNETGGGTIFDYGTYPEQDRDIFDLKTLSATFRDVSGHVDVESALSDGVRNIAAELLLRKWKRQDAGEVGLDFVGIDESHCTRQIREAVMLASRQTNRSAILPVQGVGITATALPMAEFKLKDGEVIEPVDFRWIINQAPDGTWHVRNDVNLWKSFVQSRLQLDPSVAHSITLPGFEPRFVELLSQHLSSESRTKGFGRGRWKDIWSCLPGRRNDWWDCLVGAACMRSVYQHFARVQEQQQQIQRRRQNAPPRSQVRSDRGRSFFFDR